MTDIKVSELPEITSLDDSDLLMAVHLVDGPTGSKKITVANIRNVFIAAALAAHVAAADPHPGYRLESVSVPWADLSGVPSTFTPSAHTHAIADVTGLQAALDSKVDDSQLGAANGVATLDVGGKLNTSQLPALGITDTFVVANQAAMLALSCQQGDVAVRTDLSKTFILTASPASTLGNWQELLSPTSASSIVTSVNGNIGAVVITLASLSGQPLDAGLTSIAALTGTGYVKATATDTYALATTIPWSDLTGVPASFNPAVHDFLSHQVGGLTLGQVLLAVGASSYNFVTMNGDVTINMSGTTTIGANRVTLNMLAQIASSTFLGRITGGSGNVEALDVSQVKTLLNLTGTNSGDQTITLTGDVTGSGTGSFYTTISNNVVTNAKLALAPAYSFKGNNTSGNANPQDLTVAQVKSLLAYTAGDITGLTAWATKAYPANAAGLLRNDGTGILFWETTSYLPSASYTASDVFIKVTSLDGSGSGLDADLLDGQHASVFALDSAVVHIAGTETITGTKTFSTAIKAPRYDVATGAVILRSGDTQLFLSVENSLGTQKFAVDDAGITFLGYTVWHSGNDGYASGLDADTLDGIDGNKFFRPISDGLPVSDLNTAKTSRQAILFESTTANAPTAYWGTVINIPTYSADDAYPVQLAVTHAFPQMYIRGYSGSAWTAWATVWTSYSDGAGSGLDADLLDGQQGTYYATDSAVVHIAGNETITGTKTFAGPVVSQVASASACLVAARIGVADWYAGVTDDGYWSIATGITAYTDAELKSSKRKLAITANGIIAYGGVVATSIGPSATANVCWLDYFSGGARLIATGPDTSTRGVIRLVVASSNASLYETPVTINADASISIGADPGGSDLLRVGGTVRISPSANTTSQLLAVSPSSTAFSITSYSAGVYLGFGVLLSGGSWVADGDGSNNAALLFYDKSSGSMRWYADNDTTFDWDVAGGLLLWDADTRWRGQLRPWADIYLDDSAQDNGRLILSNKPFGYNAAYRSLMIGNNGTTYGTDAITIALGVDVSTIAGGSFTGNGTELIIRRNARILVPNAGGTDFELVATLSGRQWSFDGPAGASGPEATAAVRAGNVAASKYVAIGYDTDNDRGYIQALHSGTANKTLALQPNGGSVTINGNLTWHAGNDGAASGLDADLLDGSHASAFMTIAGNETVTGTKVFNSGTNPTSSQQGVTPWVSGSSAALLAFVIPSAAANQKIWDIRTYSDGKLEIAAPLDTYASSNAAISITRSGNTIAAVGINGTSLTFNSNEIWNAGSSGSTFRAWLGSGTADGTTFLRGDGVWGTISATGVFWAKISNSSTIAVTGTVTATINRLHVVSGTSASYTITLPSASAGDVIGFTVKDFASADKFYKLDAGAGVLICGRTRYLTLTHTNVVLLIYDGTAWQPLVLNLDSPWATQTTITITGSITNPTKGTTSIDEVQWCRRGSNVHVRWRYLQSTAGTAGSGDYFIDMPTGITIDTGVHATITTAGALGEYYSIAPYAVPGSFGGIDSGSSARANVLSVLPYSTTQVRVVFDGPSVDYWRSNHYSLASASNIGLAFGCILAAADW